MGVRKKQGEFSVEKEYYRGKTTNEVELKALRSERKKPELQSLLDAGNLPELIKKAQEFLTMESAVGDMAYYRKLVFDKKTLANDNKFRLPKLPEVERVVIQLLKDGKSTTDVWEMFSENVTDDQGNTSKKYALTMPTIEKRKPSKVA